MSTYSAQNNQPITTLCRCCARQVVFFQDENLRECAACGMLNARPQSTGKTFDFLQRANQQRSSCDFTNAEASYQHVLQEHPTEHEALWGLALCRYGVEYIEDPKTQMLMPTCHFTRRKPLMEDSDYLLACENAPASVRLQYEADAQYIDAIQAGIRASARDCLPFDVFICHKATVPGTDMRPSDFEYARSLYYKLIQMGYQTFFAHETLQHVAGANYEARIYHALHTAKVMLVICTREDYLNTAWVRSEWSRYLERMDADGDCVLVPLLYDGMVPEALPTPFSHRNLEGLRMGELDSLDKLRSILRQHIRPRSTEKPAAQGTAPILPQINIDTDRIKGFLSARWQDAKEAAFSVKGSLLTLVGKATGDTVPEGPYYSDEDYKHGRVAKFLTASSPDHKAKLGRVTAVLLISLALSAMVATCLIAALFYITLDTNGIQHNYLTFHGYNAYHSTYAAEEDLLSQLVPIIVLSALSLSRICSAVLLRKRTMLSSHLRVHSFAIASLISIYIINYFGTESNPLDHVSPFFLVLIIGAFCLALYDISRLLQHPADCDPVNGKRMILFSSVPGTMGIVAGSVLLLSFIWQKLVIIYPEAPVRSASSLAAQHGMNIPWFSSLFSDSVLPDAAWCYSILLPAIIIALLSAVFLNKYPLVSQIVSGSCLTPLLCAIYMFIRILSGSDFSAETLYYNDNITIYCALLSAVLAAINYNRQLNRLNMRKPARL